MKKKDTIFHLIKNYNEPIGEIRKFIEPLFINEIEEDFDLLIEDIKEYWNAIHPMVRDYINMYTLVNNQEKGEINRLEQRLASNKRTLEREQNNVTKLGKNVGDLKEALSQIGTEKRNLEGRLKDEANILLKEFDKEKKILEILAETNLPEGESLSNAIELVRDSISNSNEIAEYETKIQEYEKTIGKMKKSNERIQEELAEHFSQKILTMVEEMDDLKEQIESSG